MAIGYQSAASSSSGWGGSITVNKPSDVAEGDVMVARVYVAGASATVTPPSGWTLVTSKAEVSNALYLYYKVAGGSEGASYQWSLSESAAIAGGIARFTGVDTDTPSDCSATSNSSGWGNAPNAPAVTTATDGAMLVWGCGNSGNQAITPPSGFDEPYETSSPRLNESYDEQATAGSSGTKTGSLAGDANWCCILWALRPASGSPPAAATPHRTLLGVGT